MRGCKRREPGLDLERAAAKFARWRQGRERGERIPAPLWELAVQLAGEHGLSRTTAALSLDYYALKKRVEHQPAPAVSVAQPPAQPAFVELAPLAVAPPSQCLVEIQNTVGSTLRVYLPAGQVPDLVALARSFGDAR
jgi:hypothetical protein